MVVSHAVNQGIDSGERPVRKKIEIYGKSAAKLLKVHSRNHTWLGSRMYPSVLTPLCPDEVEHVEYIMKVSKE